MARKLKRAAKAKKTSRISRSVMAELLTDLCGRLKEQVWIAEAIAKASAPTDATLMGDWHMVKVIELAANAHLSDLRKVKEFADLINEKVAP
jgi:hypothetical protein